MKKLLLICLLIAVGAMSALTWDEAIELLDMQNAYLKDMLKVSANSRYDVKPGMYEMYPIATTFYEIYMEMGIETVSVYEWIDNDWVYVSSMGLTYENGVCTQLDMYLDEYNMRFHFTWESGHIVQSVQEVEMEGVWNEFTRETYDWSGDNLDYALREMNAVGNWVDYQRFYWTYSGSQVTECLIQLNLVTEWQDEERYTATWSRNDIDQVIGEYWSDEWFNDYRDTYTYNGDGNCLTDLCEYWDVDSWVNDGLDSYTYEGAYVIESLSQVWYGEWEDDNRTLISWAGGGMTEQVLQYWSVDEWINDEKLVFNSNAAGDDTPAPAIELTACPNPFNPDVTVNYSLATPGEVSVKVYDVRGRCVRTLHEGMDEAGPHSLTWNGVDNSGAAVASGVYLLRLDTPQGSAVRKATLLK